MNATKTKLGLLAATVLSMVALPAYAAPANRKEAPRGRQLQIQKRDRDQKTDFRKDRDRRDIKYDRDDTDVRVQVRIGGPVIVHRPEPVQYETRMETVLVEPAHYEVRTEEVLVQEGRWEERLIPGRREMLRDSRGNYHEVQVTADRIERVWCPPVYETRTVKVLVPARYETRTVRVPVSDRYDERCDDRCDDRHDGRTSTARQAIGIGLQILGQVLDR